MNDGEITIPSSKVSVAETTLSHLNEVSSKAQFCVALINGLGQQLHYDFRELFAQQVSYMQKNTNLMLLMHLQK